MAGSRRSAHAVTALRVVFHRRLCHTALVTRTVMETPVTMEASVTISCGVIIAERVG